MAFTNVTIRQISDRQVRVTATLASQQGGTIGLFGATGSAPNVRLPEAFKTEHYTYPDGHPVPFQDAIWVSFTQSTPLSVGVEKTGTTVEDFRITFFETGSVSHDLDIMINYH